MQNEFETPLATSTMKELTQLKTHKKYENEMERYSQNEKTMKNYECYEQAFLIGLLNQFCSFKLQKPFKQSIIIESKPEIISIGFKNETIDIRKIAEDQCKLFADKTETDSISDKTRMRRFAKNRSTFIINFLFDISLEYGFFFNSVLSKKSQKCFQIERINEVFFNNQLLYKRNDINVIGEKLNSYLLNLVKDRKVVDIEMNDQSIQTFFVL